MRFFSALLLLFFLPPTASAYVKVLTDKPLIQYKTFDPANPPKDMPHLEASEAAGAMSEFRIRAAVNQELAGRQRNDNGWTSFVNVHGMTVTISLHVTIWLPKGAPEKLKEHEEGHRRIAERIYKERAVAALKAAAAPMDGQRLSADGATAREADRNAQNSALMTMAKEYLSQTTGVVNEIGNTYDALTAHGTNDKPVEEAIKEAFERYDQAHPAAQPDKSPDKTPGK